MKAIDKKLSVNKLTEYLDAKAVRRAKIVQQQQTENEHPSQYYGLAQQGLKKVLVSAGPAAEYEIQLAHILAHSGWGNYPGKLTKNNAEAFRSAWTAINSSALISESLVLRKPTEQFEPRMFGDVRISNRADVEVIIQKRKTKYGVVKFYFNKEHPLTAFSGQVLAALLHDASIELHGERSVSRDAIFVCDAFQSKLFTAPSHRKLHVAEAVAAAKEFSMHWDNMP